MNRYTGIALKDDPTILGWLFHLAHSFLFTVLNVAFDSFSGVILMIHSRGANGSYVNHYTDSSLNRDYNYNPVFYVWM